mgnify:CR=1 FL=1
MTRPAGPGGEVRLVLWTPRWAARFRKDVPASSCHRMTSINTDGSVIIAPMTMGEGVYPWRVPCRFQRRPGFVALDQLRTVDAERLLRRLGRLTPQTVTAVLQRLQEMFAE